MFCLDKKCEAETVSKRETKKKMTRTSQSDQSDNNLISDKGISFKITGSQKGFEGWEREIETDRVRRGEGKRVRERGRRDSLFYWLITA